MNTSALTDLQIEDEIWIIYIFLAIAGIYANSLEKKDINTFSKANSKSAHEINLTVLIIAFFIYAYFVKRAYKNIRTLKNNITNSKHLAANFSLIGSILFLVAGTFFILAEVNSTISDSQLGAF